MGPLDPVKFNTVVTTAGGSIQSIQKTREGKQFFSFNPVNGDQVTRPDRKPGTCQPVQFKTVEHNLKPYDEKQNPNGYKSVTNNQNKITYTYPDGHTISEKIEGGKLTEVDTSQKLPEGKGSIETETTPQVNVFRRKTESGDIEFQATTNLDTGKTERTGEMKRPFGNCTAKP